MSNDNLLTKLCPICNSENYEQLLNLDTNKMDNSPLYSCIKINSCNNCGHIYNSLSENEFDGLLKYYNEEYALTNLSAPDKKGDRPGSLSQNSINRFELLYQLSKSYVNENSHILDIGCAIGGFLTHLKSKGLNNLYGIDYTQNYVNYCSDKSFLNVKLGSAENIPFEENKFDIIYMDQVLEHLLYPRKVFQEVKRVLKNGGYFCLGIPNAQEYTNSYIFDFFWFLMKEHIQHFDIQHLKMLAQSEGFELIDYTKSNIPMMGDNALLPNLNVIFKLTTKDNKNSKEIYKNDPSLKLNIANYINIEYQRLEKKKQIISNLCKNGNTIYIWGIGREFLYLLNNSQLSSYNNLILIDGNSYKREYLKINNLTIHKPEILLNAKKNDALLITASSYIDKLKEIALEEYQFCGKFINI